MAHIYRTFAQLIPSGLRGKIKTFLSYTTITIDSESFIGFVTAYSLLLGVIAGFFLGLAYSISFWIFFASVVVICNVMVYVWLMLLVDTKAELVEDALPDALQLMASNLRSGMTPEKALLLSSRPEFGPLKEEIDIIGRKVTLGKNIGLALMEMAKRVRSRRLVRAVELINSGLDSGGSLAILLEATSHDLREQFLVDKKIKASVTMYVIFIFSAAAVISPVLFGLSSFLVEIIQSSFSQINIPTSALASLPIRSGQISLDPAFVTSFIIFFQIVNCFMASIILGLISKGKQREGFKYFIVMVVIAIPLFFLTRYVIHGALGGLFNI